MRLRVAEIYKDAVAHVLRNKPIEAAHSLCDASLVGRNHLAQVFSVHALGHRRRADQVREQHRDPATLRHSLVLRLNASGSLGNWPYQLSTLIDSREYLSTMPERIADVLQILICQIGEYRNVNLILSKTLSVLTEAVRNLLHRRPQRLCRHALSNRCMGSAWSATRNHTTTAEALAVERRLLRNPKNLP